MSDTGRPMTPFAAFVPPSEKTAADTQPPPQIPGPARIPSDIAEMRGFNDSRDTEPTTDQPGDSATMRIDSESTPPDGPFAVRQVLKELRGFKEGFAEMRGHCRSAAENSFATAEAVRGLRLEMQELKKEHNARLVRLEIDRLWIPRLVATGALLVATVALVIALLAYQHR